MSCSSLMRSTAVPEPSWIGPARPPGSRSITRLRRSRVQRAAAASQLLQFLLLRASSVAEQLTELGFGVQGELLSVKEEGGSAGDSEGFSVRNVLADAVLGGLIRDCGVISGHVQPEFLGEGPEQCCLGVLLL